VKEGGSGVTSHGSQVVFFASCCDRQADRFEVRSAIAIERKQRSHIWLNRGNEFA
jgi:hypothetical protein